MAANQLVVVDNTDASIQYHGPWFGDRGSRDKVGSFGAPFNNTLHGTRVTSSISFSYKGGGFIVFGSNNPRDDNGVIDPQWECFLDGVRVPPTTHFAFGENNWHMCELLTANEGTHELHVNVTVQKEQVFWFDSIQYAPAADADLTNEDLLIDAKDATLQDAMLASRAWQPWGPAVNFTTLPGATLKFDFVGTGLQWYGAIPDSHPYGPSTGTYSLNGGKPIPFKLNGLPGEGRQITLFCQLFFETPRLPYGTHTINVLYDGMQTPLTLDYLVAFGKDSYSPNAPISIDPGSLLPGKNPTGDGVQNATAKEPNNIAAIAGGAAGGAVVLLLLITLAIWYMRRRRRRDRESRIYAQPPPTYTDIPHAPGIIPFPMEQTTASRNQSSDFQLGHSTQIPSSSDMYISMSSKRTPLPTRQVYSPLPTVAIENPYHYSLSSASHAETDYFHRSDVMSGSASPPTSAAHSVNTEGPTNRRPLATDGVDVLPRFTSKRAVPPLVPPRRAVPEAAGRRSLEKLEKERARDAADQVIRAPPPIPSRQTKPSMESRRTPSLERETVNTHVVAVPFRHVDSGVRIPQVPGRPPPLPPLDVPPVYTPN